MISELQYVQQIQSSPPYLSFQIHLPTLPSLLCDDHQARQIVPDTPTSLYDWKVMQNLFMLLLTAMEG